MLVNLWGKGLDWYLHGPGAWFWHGGKFLFAFLEYLANQWCFFLALGWFLLGLWGKRWRWCEDHPCAHLPAQLPRAWREDRLYTEPATKGKCPRSSCWATIYWCEGELLSHLGCQGYLAEEQLFLAFVLAVFGTVLGMGKGSTRVILRPLLRSHHGFTRSPVSGLFTVLSQILGRQQKAKLKLPWRQKVWNKWRLKPVSGRTVASCRRRNWS